ncbi:probable chitinase 2 [Cimex lectularius]|uniref:GH18 domain-containing protein n=1 Tax=Cimex lectularius TaxID=79782 RepID=A0A8I6TK28_CIMLE|nr:probable chitinase 2 [Cimex lectularius]
MDIFVKILSSVLILGVLSYRDVDSIERNGKVVVCYVGTWAIYRPGRGMFSVDSIDPSLCTHLVYSFAGLNPSNWTIMSLDPYNDLEENFGKGNYKKMTALKKSHPHLKVTLAIGGWNEGSANYSKLAEDPNRRRIFIESVLEFMKLYDFDGLDLDWEFPTKRGGKPEDKTNFVLLIKELGQSLRQQGYILTAAVSAAIDTLSTGYDLPEVHKHLDLVHLMCYDYHGSWEKKTGPNAPLTPDTDLLTVEASVEYALDHGVPKEKLVMGVPLYGRTFILDGVNETSGKLGEPSKENEGFQGPFTKTNGFLGFNEICNELRSPEWKGHWDNISNTPWASSGSKVVVYDNAMSIKLKVNYAMEMGLAGILTWSIDTDDFHGDCSFPGDPEPKYPLVRAINEAITQSFVSPAKEKSSASQTAVSAFAFYIVFIVAILSY